jgi:PST family polysaccharide transporter
MPGDMGRPEPASSYGLKEKTLRGGVVRLFGQGANFFLRIVGVIALARLLDPEDFGLIAMVTVVTGVYERFTSAGLSTAMIQKSHVTEEEISALFWVNILVGVLLAMLCLATAPVLVRFYSEPRLFWITVIVSAGFLFNAAGVQHFALLQRQLRYFAITMIEATMQLVSICVGVAMALAGFRYWALVGTALASPAAGTVFAWLTAAWVPGVPRRPVAINSMLLFGGTVTLNSLVVYIAYNCEKALLGRFWGADSLGIYGRAYQLVSIPTASLINTAEGVAFSALSRLQDDHPRLKSYFLKGYSLVVSMVLPLTVFCALYANEIVSICFGPKWKEAAVIFRLMTPTILVFGMINPLAWLLLSVGLQGRSLRIALVIAPLVISAYVIGLPYGPRGVAFAYSAAMTLWLVPHIMWCLYDTAVSPKELFAAISRPFLASIVAGALTFAFHAYTWPWLNVMVSLVLGGCLMLLLYAWVLLFALGQWAFYFDVIKAFRRPAPSASTSD